MRHYHKERDAFDEYQNRCTRNMPIKTNTIGTDRVIDYAEDSPTPKHWKGTSHLPDPYKDAFKVTWPTEERINNIGQNGPTGEHYMNKYQRKLTKPTYVQRSVDGNEIEEDVIIDVYDVLDAFNVSNPATAHAIKKLLCTGSRGAKDWETDLQEAIDSLERAKSFPPLPF
jgi:hypothetical protein